MKLIKKIREDKDDIIKRLEIRGDYKNDINRIFHLDNDIRNNKQDIDKMNEDINKNNRIIRDNIKNGIDNTNIIDENKKLKIEVNHLIRVNKILIEELDNNILNIPNIPHKDTILENEIVYEVDIEEKDVKPHWDIIDNIVDFKIGVKLTGNGFPVFKGKGEKLRRALIDFALDAAEEEGYEQYGVPYVVNTQTVKGTGQYPDKEGQMYVVDDMYVIPTGEVPLTNIFRGDILNENKKICGHTPCFRKEAGYYGKDVRGLNRVHQFDKVELVRIEHPDDGYNALDEMVQFTKNIVEKLGLPYRIIKIGGKDLGFTACKAYDIEVYAKGQKKWLEVATITNLENFQADRMNLKIVKNGKKVLAHTLNGTGLAVPRIMVAILENNQTGDGIKIPDVLKKYINFDYI